MPNITVYLTDEEFVKYVSKKEIYQQKIKEFVTDTLGEKNEHKCR